MHSQTWNWVFIHQALFLITGVASTICAQLVTYHGGAHPSTLMLSWPSYVGMLLVGLLPAKGPGSNGGNTSPKQILICSVTNLAANICCNAGLQIIGSGIYQVLYSSVVIFTALLSKTFLGKSPTQVQWVAIISIAVGLGLTSHDSAPVEGKFITMVEGLAITGIGCMGYASSYVMVDHTLSKRGSIHPQRLCLCIGAVGSSFHVIYFLCYTLPRWNRLIVAGIAEHEGSAATVFWLFVLLVASSFLHNLSYFYLMRNSGAVATGVIAGLKAIGVFIVSGLLFCKLHTAQCMTTTKSVAAVIVAGGVLTYSLGSKAGGGKRKTARLLKRNDSDMELPLYSHFNGHGSKQNGH